MVPALPVLVAALVGSWEQWAALIWVQPNWALAAALLSCVAISQTGLAHSQCARARAQKGVGLMWHRQGDVAGWRQGSTSPQLVLLCVYNHTQKMEGSS